MTANHQNPFAYYEIRATVDSGEDTLSFRGAQFDDGCLGKHCTKDGALEEAEAYADTVEGGATVAWTLYGVDQHGYATAIGDFKTFEAAYDILGAIVMPMRNALNLIESKDHWAFVSMAEDMCNQSTNEDRL